MEALVAYYQRTLGILRKTYGRDHPRDTEKTLILSGLETIILNYVINMFVKGLSQNNLRKAALQKDAATYSTLQKSYEMVQATHYSLQLEKQVEEALSAKNQLVELEKFIFKYTSRTTIVALAEAQLNPNAFKTFSKGSF